MDIYQHLKQEHEEQKELARRIMETSGDSEERRELFQRFKIELESHAAAEEQSLYAALLSHPEGQEQARHSIAEHKDAADIVEELEETAMDSSAWIQRFEKLKDDVVHHIDEEEDDVFPLCRTLISTEEAQELAEKFAHRKTVDEREERASA